MENKPTFEVKEEERITITVPHQGKRITFVAPHAGPSNYNAVGKQIDEAGLLRPTFAETVSLAYSATQNKDNKYAQGILDILNNKWFWTCDLIKNVQNKGASISDRNRRNVYVPHEFQAGEQPLEELVKNPFVLALADGEEGAEKLVEIAKSQKTKPHVLNSEKPFRGNVREDITALNSNWFGMWVPFVSYVFNIYGGGCAFGLLKP